VDKLLIGFYWGDRRDTILSTSENLVSLFTSFSKIDPVFSELKYITSSKNVRSQYQWGEAYDDNVQDLSRSILESGRKQFARYNPGINLGVDFWEPAGFVVTFQGVSLKSMQIFTGFGSSGQNASNSVVITFVADSYHYNYEKVNELFRTGIKCLQPDWAVVGNRNFMLNISGQEASEVPVGWMNYFRSLKYKLFIPSQISSFDFQEGFIIQTTKEGEVFSCDNREHMEKSFDLIKKWRSKRLNRRDLISRA